MSDEEIADRLRVAAFVVPNYVEAFAAFAERFPVRREEDCPELDESAGSFRSRLAGAIRAMKGGE